MTNKEETQNLCSKRKFHWPIKGLLDQYNSDMLEAKPLTLKQIEKGLYEQWKKEEKWREKRNKYVPRALGLAVAGYSKDKIKELLKDTE